MLTKNHRLKRNSDFNYVFKKGQSSPSKYIVLYFAPTKNTCPKIGIVVSKKIGKAVTRNHVKRLMRESLRKYQDDIISNVNLVYIVRSGIENLSYEDVDKLIYETLKKNKLLKGWIWGLFAFFLLKFINTQ